MTFLRASSRSLFFPAAIAGCLAAGTLAAQTVQLPTYRVFSSNSSVLVPDGGAAFLGGNTSLRSGANSQGVPILGQLPVLGRPFRNRAFGRDVGGSQSWVTAQIIDHREWDAALLEEARRRRLARGQASPDDVRRAEMEQAAAFLSQHVARGARASAATLGEWPRKARTATRRTDDAALRLGATGSRRFP